MQEQKKEFLLNVGFAVTVGLLIFVAFKFLFSFFLPFIIALLIAYLVQKPSVYICEKIRLKREICAILLSILVFLILASLVGVVGYYFIIKAKDIFSNINGILGDISKIVSEVQNKFFSLFENFSPEINFTAENIVLNFVEDTAKKITSFFSGFAGNIVKKAPSFLFSSIVTLVATCYISKDFMQLLRFYRNLFGEKVYCKTCRIKNIISSSVFKFIKGYLLLMSLTFLVLVVGFYILKIEYAVLLALLVSIVDLLPVLGTGTVLVPWGIADVILGEARGFGILILYISVTVIRNFAEPKVIGKQMGINPLFTLVSMFIGLKLIGFWGLLLFPIILIVLIEYYKGENDLA